MPLLWFWVVQLLNLHVGRYFEILQSICQLRKFGKYQRGNQKPKISRGQKIQCLKEIGQQVRIKLKI